MSKRNPEHSLPDSPDSPEYEEALFRIKEEDGDGGPRLFRYLCLNDFWFFARHCLTLGKLLCQDPHSLHYKKPWLDHPWLFDRCREIQASPDGHLDLWPRFFFKTSLITQSLTLWDIIDNPDLRIAIISYKVEGTGESFLRQIKTECEDNQILKSHFPDVFYAHPKRESPTWTQGSLTFKRDLNPKEPTITVFGLVSGQAVSQHYDILVYDDIVVRESVANQEQIDKTNSAWQQSSALGADNPRKRYVGTRWATADTYDFLIRRKAVNLRLHDVYLKDGSVALRSKEWLEGTGEEGNIGIRGEMGRYNFSCQMRNRPVPEGSQIFDLGWIRYYDRKPEEIAKNLNVYILVDPARVTKKNTADYTAMMVIGLSDGVPRGKYHLLDLVRDRIDLVQTTELLFELVTTWKPKCVLIEQFGAQRDIEHFKYVMEERGYYFKIEPFFEKIRKEERIRRLQPSMEKGEWLFPRHGIYRQSEGKYHDMCHVLKEEEMRDWTPEGGQRHDDMVDVMSWPLSPESNQLIRWPRSTMNRKKMYVVKDEVTAWAG